ncbi:MAG TPA: hypothetical protein PLV61_00685 [Parvularculaceae bacterium]|nr:hypothetical protein [Parvularculaceae bacterium]HRX38601.1 hypothetical protein [Parvularculaceae bacterium]
MASISPDIATRLKPDLIAVVSKIYRDFCNLQAGQQVLIISDARTPDFVIASFQGVAQSFGADAVRIECAIPAGGATYQPGAQWPAMLEAAAAKADLIIDMAVGYSELIVNALKNGCRVLCPGDGIGGPFMDDVLIRTILHADVDSIRKEADLVARRMTKAKSCKIITGPENDVLEIDLSGLEAVAADGYLWDPDRKEWKTNWAFLPPAQPGVLIPVGRGDGVVNVDATLLHHPVYHEKPDSPIKLTFEKGRLVAIGGATPLAATLENWLRGLEDDGAWNGPVHLNIGVNPNALLTQSQEWERVYGSITCGMGDLSLLGQLMGDVGFELSRSRVHWDWTVAQPTILLDGEVFLKRGKLFL